MAQNNDTEHNIGPLPFGLTAEQLPDIEISFRVSSTKLFSGFDEIVIRGNGEVELLTALRRDDPPAVRKGAVEPILVARLLQLLAAEGIEGWDDNYPPVNRDYVGKMITVMLGEERVKQVSMCRVEFPEFSRAFGAIKLIAGLTDPEVLSGGFFKRI